MKKKLKKYNSGVNYISPEYNTQIQQKSGNGTATANSLIGGLGTAGAIGGEALQNSATQANSNNAEIGVNSGKYIAGGAAKGFSQGAAIGSVAGPYGALIAGAVGGIYGGISSGIKAKSINSAASNLKKTNAFIKKQNSYSATEDQGIGYAKNGLDMTQSKLKKYPGGSSSVNTNLPRFTAAENQQLLPLKGTPQYKQAIHGAIGYTPKYANPVPGSTQAAYEDSTFNAKVNAFNQRDLTKAPANFGNAIQNFDANTQQNNLNYNSQNQKLDNYSANYGGAQLPNNTSIPDLPGQMPNAMKKVPPYKNGTKGISKYPGGTDKIQLTNEERSALPPAGTPEHRQAIWDLLGYKPQNYPAGSQGYANQEKHFNSAVSLINQGYRPSISPSGNKGYEKKYAKGVKDVEIEGGEIVAEKNGSKFNIKGDYAGGPSHENGGIRISAQEGDVIFPKHRRGEVVEAIQTGNNSKLESIRKSLPKDGKYKMKDGVGKIQSKDLKKVNNPTILKSDSPRTFNPNFNTDNLGNALGTAAEIAPIAYNIGQGLFGKTVKTNRRQLTPSNYKYTDNSQPLRNEINSLYNQDKQSIRNGSGGNAGTYLSNVGLASANKFKRLQEVNNNEIARKIDTQNQNTELQNNAQAINTNLNNQYDQFDLQNSSRKQDFLATGLGQASGLAQQKTVDKNLATRDNIILNNLQSANYYIDPKTQKVVFGKKENLPQQKKGNSGIKTKYKMKK